MIICRNCGAKQIQGTLFCSECGADLEVPAVPTFELDEEEGAPAPQLPNVPWQNPGSNPAKSAPVYPQPSTSSATNTAPYGFPPDENYEPIVPPPSRPAVYNPAVPPSPAVPGFAPPNPGGYVMPPRPPKPPAPSSRSSIRDDLRLIVLNTGRVLECPDKENVIIGRFDAITGEKPDIDLTADNGVELGVSRRHVCITFRDDAPFLTDLGSKNYTFLNRQQMMRGQPYPLQNGDEVRLGNVILKVLYDPDGLL